MTETGRDAAEFVGSLAQWLDTRLPGDGPVHLGPLAKPGSGLSAGTFLVDAFRSDRGREITHQLVVRIPPEDGQGLFPWSDLSRELEFHDLLEAERIPVAPVVGLEEDSGVIGRPFVVTRRVVGRLVESNDPYLSQGWLHDETPQNQERLITNFLDALADIHRIDARLDVRALAGDTPFRRRTLGTRAVALLPRVGRLRYCTRATSIRSRLVLGESA